MLIPCLARYAGPAKFARRLHKKAASWNANGELDFLNSWSYKLGEERELILSNIPYFVSTFIHTVLTPFGRKQLCETMPPEIFVNSERQTLNS